MEKPKISKDVFVSMRCLKEASSFELQDVILNLATSHGLPHRMLHGWHKKHQGFQPTLLDGWNLAKLGHDTDNPSGMIAQTGKLKQGKVRQSGWSRVLSDL